LLNETNGIHSVQQDQVPEIRDFYFYWVHGASRAKQFCSIAAVIFGRCRNILGQRWLTSLVPSPLRKNWPVRLWPYRLQCHSD